MGSISTSNNLLYNILFLVIVKNWDSLAFTKFVGEAKIHPIWATGRFLNRKEAKSRGGNVIELRIGVLCAKHYKHI